MPDEEQKMNEDNPAQPPPPAGEHPPEAAPKTPDPAHPRGNCPGSTNGRKCEPDEHVTVESGSCQIIRRGSTHDVGRSHNWFDGPTIIIECGQEQRPPAAAAGPTTFDGTGIPPDGNAAPGADAGPAEPHGP